MSGEPGPCCKGGENGPPKGFKKYSINKKQPLTALQEDFARGSSIFSGRDRQPAGVPANGGIGIFLKDQALGPAQDAGHIAQCANPPMDAGVSQLPLGIGIANEIGAKQTPIGHGRLGKVGLAIMLKGWRGIALMGKGEGRLLRERDAAAKALSTDDQTNHYENKLFDDNSKFTRSGLVAFEIFGRLAAQKAKRCVASDFVFPDGVGIRFDFFSELSLVGRENRHKRHLRDILFSTVSGAVDLK